MSEKSDLPFFACSFVLLLERAKKKIKVARAVSKEARATATTCPKLKVLPPDEFWVCVPDIPKTESEVEDELF